jgi:hypothetical protein
MRARRQRMVGGKCCAGRQLPFVGEARRCVAVGVRKQLGLTEGSAVMRSWHWHCQCQWHFFWHGARRSSSVPDLCSRRARVNWLKKLYSRDQHLNGIIKSIGLHSITLNGVFIRFTGNTGACPPVVFLLFGRSPTRCVRYSSTRLLSEREWSAMAYRRLPACPPRGLMVRGD